VAFDASGERCVSISENAVITVWDAREYKSVKTFRDTCHTALDIGITPDGQKAVTALFDHTLNVWDIEKNSLLHILSAHTDQVNKVFGNTWW
jgi:WD40 repeat protein